MIDVESRRKVFEIQKNRELMAKLESLKKTMGVKKEENDYSPLLKDQKDLAEASLSAAQVSTPLLLEILNALVIMVESLPSKEEWDDMRASLASLKKKPKK